MSAAIPVVKNQQIWVDVDKNRFYPMVGSLESRLIFWKKKKRIKITFMFS